ncbi:hypothetical protein [Bradyrhizobium iriomotense]|uniref:Uncharacterized protein n=1 Tax=Bradyrhizobium iriomotense TaxID=441950 RepID=A0ABQ6B1Q1_9BRAD|nr:hypothetical protein [Bradyrhizobium iriomotense]GLR88332.1 hypothetical protein GCM10007857_50440 [Bradyrhizobium iriomotense]
MPPSVDHVRLRPVAPRHAAAFYFALLTTSCALASFALACATPFAAFAVIAAATLALRPALLVVAGAWLVNQTIGFAALHYPVDAATLAWGVAIGAAALGATAASSALLRALPWNRMPLVLALTLVCAFGAYEFALFAVTPVLGGASAFTTAIVTRLGLLNVAWLLGLLAACEIVRLIAPVRRGHALAQ